MIFSQNGIELLKRVEGSSPHLYNDSAGLPTIGVGHLLTRDELSSGKINILGAHVKYSSGLTEIQIEKLLSHDAAFAEGAVNVCDINLTQNQFDALVCFVFNIGRGAFNQSTLKKHLVAGNLNKIPEQLRRWIYAGGKISKGLIGRREQEIKLFLTN
jgi:lysozyme